MVEPMMVQIYPEKAKPGCTYFDTFDYQGKTYYLNTTIESSLLSVKKSWYSKESKKIQVGEHYIDDKGKEWWSYIVWLKDGHHYAYTTFKPPETYIKRIIEVSPAPPEKNHKKEYYKGYEMPVIPLMWGVFLLICFVSTVFVGFGAIWAVCGAIFYHVRKGVLEKPFEHDFGFDVEATVAEWQRELDI